MHLHTVASLHADALIIINILLLYVTRLLHNYAGRNIMSKAEMLLLSSWLWYYVYWKGEVNACIRQFA